MVAITWRMSLLAIVFVYLAEITATDPPVDAQPGTRRGTQPHKFGPNNDRSLILTSATPYVPFQKITHHSAVPYSHAISVKIVWQATQVMRQA
jgi:hypothetical protein